MSVEPQSKEDDHFFAISKLGIEDRNIGPISGAPGQMKMLRISSLRVDGNYQRAMTVGSVRNIQRICKAFDWAKFLPVIVVEIEDGLWAIVDGQHRATAALTIGIDRVPCYELQCSMSEAAGAFAAINGNVTPMKPVDLWFARLAAGENEALDLKAVLDAADVSVTRKRKGLRVGETFAVTVLQRALDGYGASTLGTILQAITQTAEGNAGMVVGFVVHGIGKSIITKPNLLNEPSLLFDAMDDWPIDEAAHRANIESARTGNPIQYIITRELNDHLRSKGLCR